MEKQPNRFGGGARTNANGLHFEQTTSLTIALINAGYTVTQTPEKTIVFKNGKEIGIVVSQNQLYKGFLTPQGINYKDYNSKKWCPDDAFINFENQTAYIIEKKFQNTSGSVDEKLPNCHFKKLEYQKLFCNDKLNFKVEFIYIFNDWFQDPRYKDTLQYILDIGCHYYYNEIPLNLLGL